MVRLEAALQVLGESRRSADQGSTPEGSRTVSRATCGRTILKFIQRSHTNREDLSQPHLQQAMESLNGCATKLFRACQSQCGVHRHQWRGSEVESTSCRVATRASSQAGSGREPRPRKPACCQRPRWIWPQFTCAMVPT